MAGQAPKEGASKYKTTVNLPKTDLPMQAGLAKREPEILAAWEAQDLYGRIIAARKDAPVFVLHDGPPYSNGHIHYGHILNKLLKDLVVKSRSMAGFRAPYVPGWDTHGLPIEKAIETELKGKRWEMTPAQVRAACRDYAMKYVAIQRTEFKRLGVFGAWEQPYLTLDHSYEAAIARALAKFTRDGYLYRGKKPVQWCSTDRTALATAEVEFKQKISPSVYVRFPLVDRGGLDAAHPEFAGKQLAYVIWTTTPWTLPANLAIVAHPRLAYVAVPNPGDRNEYLIVAKALAASVLAAITAPGSVGAASPSHDGAAGSASHDGAAGSASHDGDAGSASHDGAAGSAAHDGAAGSASHDGAAGASGGVAGAVELTADDMKSLEGGRYRHPFVSHVADVGDAAYRLWFADYVEDTAGTGLVHTAPGHGADDYKTGMAHDLPPYAPLDDAARYIEGVAIESADGSRVELAGKSTEEANPIIVAHLYATRYLLNPPTDKIEHSYAHCWRCKRPIVFRATPQWFLSIDHLGFRDKALAEIEKTDWVPTWGEARITAMIANRPDWVLSRQRLWGTPIPAFYCKDCGAEHANADTMEHVANIFEREGADAWWVREASELVPPGTACAKCGGGQLEKEKDIVDVWFESGVSWLAMQARPDAADYTDIDVYLEGSDQHRGWFHSSLLAGVGVMGRAPYKTVITHGFVMDEHGQEYSKSRIQKAKAEGKKIDYIEPDLVIAKSGAEMFRLWTASVEYRNDITYSQTILDGLTEWYRKYRNTVRFLLGNLADFKPDEFSRDIATVAVDRYVLQELDELVRDVRAAYHEYRFHDVHRLLVDFVSVTVSARYNDVTKDRLYCDPVNSPGRRAAQVVMYECARALITLAAPIMCFTCEDLWAHLPKRASDPDSVHLAVFPAVHEGKEDAMLANDFERLFAWRDRVNAALEPFRAAKHKSDDAAISIAAPAGDRAILERHMLELAELFIVSSVQLDTADGDSVTVTEHIGLRCERCRRHYDQLAAEPNDVCTRCADALAAIKAS